jgi:membrane protein YqaA with SNARE-associated domain
MKWFGPDTARVIFELWAWLLVIVLSALGVVGNLTLYKLGKEGQEAVASRFPRIDPARWKRASELFESRGSWILLLSFLPGLGVVLSTAAGAYGFRSPEFVIWVLIAKFFRNWLLLIILANFYYLVAG